MKKFLLIIAVVLFFTSALGCQGSNKPGVKKSDSSQKAAKPVSEKTERVKITEEENANTFDGLNPVELEKPPFRYFLAKDNTTGIRPLKLELKSSKKNDITDNKNWFKTNDLALPAYQTRDDSDEMDAIYGNGKLPKDIKGNAKLIKAKIEGALSYPDQSMLILGIYNDPRKINYEFFEEPDKNYLISADPGMKNVKYAFDLTNFMVPPGVDTSNYMFTKQVINWAEENNGVLYVSNTGGGYADDVKGLNAYLTAIDLTSKKIIWRSQPLVSNANFVVIDDIIVSGYGFTNEPDNLYLSNKYTGEIIETIPIKTAPYYLLVKGDLLYVRTYDHDYVFEIVR